MKKIHRDILALSVPAVIATITTPLLGLMDTAFTGHMGGAVYLAGIALGGNLFNLVYWQFGFLRMATSGLTAQAVGASDEKEQWFVLYRSLSFALVAGLILIALQWPIAMLYKFLADPGGSAWEQAQLYFSILIWGAPAVLATTAFSGWFVGMHSSARAMWMSIAIDVANIILTAALVLGCKMKVPGVAIGTLVAQYTGLFVAVALAVKGKSLPRFNLKELIVGKELKRYFSVSSDIFLRTLCIIAVTLWFTRMGARSGSTVLAANALLMQLFILFSHVMDGLAYAGEALVGSAVGRRDRPELISAVKALLKWGVVTALIFTTIYFFCGEEVLNLLSDDEGVRITAREYLPWAVSIPLLSFGAFIWDGVFIGATATRSMLVSIAASTALFFVLEFALRPSLGNNALWIAFLAYLLFRSVSLTIIFSLSKSWQLRQR